jgi:L-fucose isomerase-like protein
MELNLTLVVFASNLHDGNSVSGSRETLYSDFKSRYSLKVVSAQEYEPIKGQEEFAIAFIATGGTEQLFLNNWQKISKPLVILSDSFHNSLAATLEISSWLSNSGIKHKHLNFPIDPSKKYMEQLHEDISMLCNIQKAFKEITNTKIGLIGDASPWLISSDVDKYSLTSRFGAKFVDIPVSSLEEKYKNIDNYTGKYAINSDDSAKLIDSFSRLTVGDRSSKDVVDAVKMYIAIKQIVQENELNAISVKCFDLISSCNTTACLALSVLNDKGLVSGCEGDIPTLWSMIIARSLLNKAVFMANPSSIDRGDNTVDFAHCTTPVSFSESFNLPSHYESKSGIGVSAKLILGKYTIFKCGGEKLDKFFAAHGEVIENTNVTERCRTQVKFRFKSTEDMDNFLNSHLGNHIILIPGKHKKEITSFFELY